MILFPIVLAVASIAVMGALGLVSHPGVWFIVFTAFLSGLTAGMVME